MNDESIEVACALDVTQKSEYALMLAVLATSLAKNHIDPRPLSLQVFHRGATREMRERIEGPAIAYGATVTWTEIDEERIARLGGVVSYETAGYYMKLLIPELVAPRLKRVIYLDVDIVVLADIARLWDVHHDAIAGCCVDRFIRTLGHSRIRPDLDVVNRRAFLTGMGCDPDAPYFNSGVMLIDTQRWVSNGVARRVVEYAERYSSRNQDQDGLNVILSGAWRALDPRWNVFPRLSQDFEEPPPDPPYAVHFCWYKPMETDYETRYVVSPSKSAFRRIFYNYLAHTAFASTPAGDGGVS